MTKWQYLDKQKKRHSSIKYFTKSLVVRGCSIKIPRCEGTEGRWALGHEPDVVELNSDRQ